MGTRSRTALTPALDVDAAPSAAAKARHRAPGSNVLQLTTQQRPARSSGAPKRPAPTAPQLQDSSEGLSTLLEVAGSYFSDAHSDTSLVEAATAVADIWHQQERELRTHVSCVLRPVLHKEARLAARAAGIAAKRQERRTKVLEQGPRRSGRVPGGDMQQPGRNTPEANNLYATQQQQHQQYNGDGQRSSKRPRTRAAAAQSPRLSNNNNNNNNHSSNTRTRQLQQPQQQQTVCLEWLLKRQRRQAEAAAAAAAAAQAAALQSGGAGSDSSSDDEPGSDSGGISSCGSKGGGGGGSGTSPDPQSGGGGRIAGQLGSTAAHQQQQRQQEQQREGSIVTPWGRVVGSASRRKMLRKPCPSALQ